MTKRLPVTAGPAPLEEYAAQFDDLFAQRSQREAFRRYLGRSCCPRSATRHLRTSGMSMALISTRRPDPSQQSTGRPRSIAEHAHPAAPGGTDNIGRWIQTRG